jgi:hypothetical protein
MTMSQYRPSSFPRRASRTIFATLAFCAAVALPQGAGAHQPTANAAAPASAPLSTQVTGRLEAIAVTDRATGITRSYPILVTSDGQRYRLENAGATAIGAAVAVTGKLSNHTLVAESVRGATSQGAAS